MSRLPFEKNLRKGQARAVALARELFASGKLNIQLPTGYGKTRTGAAIYAQAQASQQCTRLLVVVPTTAQLDQFTEDGHTDFEDVGLQGETVVSDISFLGTAQCINRHRKNVCQIYACTVQSLLSSRVRDAVHELMQSGRWMMIIDEYHHYGEEKVWGKTIREIQAYPSCVFTLAMSATPYRVKQDSFFGMPNLVVSYRSAVEERAVKPLKCHAYTYRLDAIENGDIRSYTTKELEDLAGGASEEKLQRLLGSMRWSPKYISPIVNVPISRMLEQRVETGYRLQCLITAFCCLHANLVCGQIKDNFPELSVDWVGTGPDGRSDAENKKILAKFCPPKRNGKRSEDDISLDILVHVGMAGEGLDTVYVSEVIQLNSARRTNQHDQQHGRAARYLPGVMGYINVESGTDYAKGYKGRAIELSFDVDPTQPPPPVDPSDEEEDTDTDIDLPPLPEEPGVRLYDLEMIDIETGEAEREIANISQAAEQAGIRAEMSSDDEFTERIIAAYKAMKIKEHTKHNEKAIIAQWRKSVEYSVTYVAKQAALAVAGEGWQEKGLMGDIKKRINTRKKRELGASVDNSLSVLQQHYAWLQELSTYISGGSVPSWLR